MLLLAVAPVFAGLDIVRTSGIAVTGADAVRFIDPAGIAVTGADGFLAFTPNGIAVTGADGIAVTGADGLTYLSANGVSVTSPSGIAVTGADGIAVTGADGIAVTGADGQTISADSVFIALPQGIAVTGADRAEMRGVAGMTPIGNDGLNLVEANGIAVTGADRIGVNSADGIAVTGADGQVFSISPAGIAVTGADSIVFYVANGIAVTGADGIAVTGADDGSGSALGLVGLQSLDPELALLLNRITDDSNVNAAIVYHELPDESDVADLAGLGIPGGVRYRSLPVIAVTATRHQLIEVSRLPAVRSIYGNRTLEVNSDPYMALDCAPRVANDAELTTNNGGQPLSGSGVNVAVLDTGVDATHPDLAGRVVRNVKLVDTQSIGVGFNPPLNIEGLPNTDTLQGHGTFVAGVIAGSGARSGGQYAGVAPGAGIVGLSAGDLTLIGVLAGFDYLLTNGSALNVGVVNCSFSANTVFDFNDPVNVATRLLTNAGINVVFSAGNTGPGTQTLNPYSVAPWVISVGGTDLNGRLADFSSRGSFSNSLFHPTLVAPAVSLIGPRAVGVTGIVGLIGADLQRLSALELPWYTTASGTSFSAPQVSATIAMMLQANSSLTPAQIRDILQRSATPIPERFYHEVGAGMLNAHAAVREAAFPAVKTGTWRAALDNTTVQFINDPTKQFSGTSPAIGQFETTVVIPQNAVRSAVQIAWGPLLTLNDLSLTLVAPGGTSYTVNTLNLPGLTGKRERLVLSMPAAGTWKIRVKNSSVLALTTQPFVGTVETTRAQFSAIGNLGSLNASQQADALAALRTRVMSAPGGRFRPNFPVTRAALAEALVCGAHVPQYLATQPMFSDIHNLPTRNFVESCQFPANGPLFDVAGSGSFNSTQFVSRLSAAVVLVKAAGFASLAEAQQGASLPITDGSTIPSELRGYVAVALSKNLLTVTGNKFRPQDSLSRIELAHAMVAMQQVMGY
jgi:serine protease AprX